MDPRSGWGQLLLSHGVLPRVGLGAAGGLQQLVERWGAGVSEAPGMGEVAGTGAQRALRGLTGAAGLHGCEREEQGSGEQGHSQRRRLPAFAQQLCLSTVAAECFQAPKLLIILINSSAILTK